MQSFTKTEISWIAVEFERMSLEYQKSFELATERLTANMCRKRADQYIDISKRMKEALKKGSKRLEIK